MVGQGGDGESCNRFKGLLFLMLNCVEQEQDMFWNSRIMCIFYS